MSALYARLLGRMPIGWLQLVHNKGRFAAALAGVAFANILVFVQLGVLGALTTSTVQPYSIFKGDIMISSADSNTLSDGGNVARHYLLRALSVPGVTGGTPVFIGKVDWQVNERRSTVLQALALPTDAVEFITPHLRSQFLRLALPDTALIDRGTRGGTPELFDAISPTTPVIYEFNNRRVTFIGTMQIGAAFSSDGNVLMSDQSFLDFFANRSSTAPNRLLLSVADGASAARTVNLLRQILPVDTLHIRSLADTMAADTRYQTTERPVGVIFGLGTFVGILVGLVIVYQVLSTDVADHLKEYATFKAMGYGQPFFLGIIFEEALILAVLGFIPGALVSTGIYQLLVAKSGLAINMTVARAIVVFLGTLAACSISGAVATRRLAHADPADLF
ncbi:MAG: FtsX-like permease family protein [Hyphomicrobiales bacterium]|nr:FtsX-like permease family protein [Hyphomicrobiales bacterium]